MRWGRRGGGRAEVICIAPTTDGRGQKRYVYTYGGGKQGLPEKAKKERKTLLYTGRCIGCWTPLKFEREEEETEGPITIF